MKKPTIIIYTDGSSRGNPGPGGWGAIIAWGDDKSKVESVKHAPLETARARSVSPSLMGSKVIELGGGEKHTTNNRMELAAAIAALGVARDLARLPPPKVTQADYKETPSIPLVSSHSTSVNLRAGFGGQVEKENLPELISGDTIDLVATMELNMFRGKRELRLRIVSLSKKI